MITNPEWNKPDERAYFHQLSHDCILRLSEVFKAVSKGDVDIDTAFRRYAKILKDDIIDPEFLSFAIENLNELTLYIAKGISNIRIHRNDVDEIWFDVDGV